MLSLNRPQSATQRNTHHPLRPETYRRQPVVRPRLTAFLPPQPVAAIHPQPLEETASRCPAYYLPLQSHARPLLSQSRLLRIHTCDPPQWACPFPDLLPCLERWETFRPNTRDAMGLARVQAEYTSTRRVPRQRLQLVIGFPQPQAL